MANRWARQAALSRTALVAAILTSTGCGGAAASGGDVAVESGRANARPNMEALPGLAEDRVFSQRMQFAWLLAEQTFEVPDPAPPAARDAGALRDWADSALQGWLAEKAHNVETARRELDLAADEAHLQRIVAGAVVGLMYEDIARVLRSVPVPDELAAEPEIAAVYRDVVEFQAEPYVEHARRAYRACAANAIQTESMRHWSAFCARRVERLPDPRRQLAQGEATVLVSYDPD